MTRRLGFFAFFFGTIALAGCSSDTGTKPPEQPECSFHSDCPNSGVCYLGKCNPTVSCLERKNCNSVPVCADQRCICNETNNRCLPVCVTDNDCSKNGQCVDGQCTAYPESWSGMPFPSAARGTLRVGLGRVDLDFPMGVSMAGYAMRRGPHTPYQDSLGGSNAWFARPDVRAIAFDDGKEMFVLVRIPTGWSTDEMLTETARKVQMKIGMNLVDRIITNAPHSHALPARYWHLVKGLGFGFFGYDEFNFEIFDRLTGSFADAVVMAVQDLHPARFGYTVLDNFDPSGRVHRDRREQNDNLPNYLGKDDRMVLMRVDDPDGHPIAVLTNFGMHGTVFDYDNPIVNADAPGGVETTLTQKASAKYGREVLGMYIQGNAGDISPGGDFAGHKETEVMQVVGEEAWKAMDAAIDGITTRADVEVGIVTQRIPITHEALGYGPMEFHDDDVVCENSPPYFRYGAFQCVDGHYHDSDPATHYADGNLDCVFAVECLTSGYPVPQFQKTVLSVARLGDLAMATMPGEPVSQFGRDLSDRIKSAIPGIAAATTLGYSQDHHFYLLNEDDWLQGGYEPSRDIWGWKLGPYLQDRSVALAGELAKPLEMRVIDNGNFKPMIWTDPAAELVPVAINDSEGAPDEIFTDVAATVERMQLVKLAWRGGHPGLDHPHITLEIDRGSGFEPYKRAGGLLYDDSGFEMLVHYDGTCTKSQCTQHKWRIDWEERRDFPAGKYRFTVEGRAQVGGQKMDYTLHSSAFDVVPSTKLAVYDLRVTGDAIEGRVVDPAIVEFVPDGDRRVADDRASHLLMSELAPSFLGAPLPDGTALTGHGTIHRTGMADVSLDGSTATIQTITEARTRIVAYDASGAPQMGGAGQQPTTKFTMVGPSLAGSPAGDYLVTLTLTDALGNSGTVTATITK